MPRFHATAAGVLMGLLVASCGQKGGLYLPDSAPAKVHAPTATTSPPANPPAGSPPASPQPDPQSSPPAAPGTSAPPAAPADDPATRRKAPATPDPSSSQ